MLDIHEIINRTKVETNYERSIFRALGMIRDRALYWESEMDFNRAVAYGAAADILAYAMMENWEALNNFDIYARENEENVD